MTNFIRKIIFLIFILKSSFLFSQVVFPKDFEQRMEKYGVSLTPSFFTTQADVTLKGFKIMEASGTPVSSKFFMLKNKKEKMNIGFYIDTCKNPYNLLAEVKNDFPVLFGLAENQIEEVKYMNEWKMLFNSDEVVILRPTQGQKILTPFNEYDNMFICCCYNHNKKGKLYYIVNFNGNSEQMFSKYMEIMMSFSFNPHLSNQEMKPELIVQTGSNDYIISLASSLSGKLMAYAGGEGTIKILLGDGSKELRTIQAHSKQIRKVSFSNNERMIVSCSLDSTIKIWETETGKLIATFRGHNSRVNSVSFFDNDTKLISTASDSTIKLWDIEKKKCYKTIGKLNAKVALIDIHPVIQKALISIFDGTILILDLKTTEYKIIKPKAEMKQITDLAFIYSDVIALTDGVSVLMFNPDSGELLKTITNEEDSGFVQLAYRKIADNNINLVMLTKHGYMKIYDYAKHSIVKTFKCPVPNWKGDFYDVIINDKYNMVYYSSTAYCFTYNLVNEDYGFIGASGDIPQHIEPDLNKDFITIHYLDQYALFSLKNGRITWTPDKSVIKNNKLGIANKYNGHILSLSTNGQIVAFDYSQKKATYKFTPISTPVSFVAIQNDSTVLYRTNDKQIYLHYKGNKQDKLIASDYNMKHNMIASIRDTFLLVQEKENIYLKNVFNDKKILLQKQNTYLPVLHFSINKNAIALLTNDSIVNIFDNATLKNIKNIDITKYNIIPKYIYLNPVKTEIAVVTYDSQVLIIDYLSEKLINQFKADKQNMFPCLYTSDGRLLITYADDGIIKFWETTNYTQTLSSYASASNETYITTSPGKYYVASAGIQKSSYFSMAYYSFGNNVFELSELDVEYNRPDIIANLLNYESAEVIQAYQKLYQKRLKKMNVIENLNNSNNRPLLFSIYNLPPFVSSPKLKLFFRLHDDNKKLKSLKICINDVPVNGIMGDTIVDGATLSNYSSMPLAFSIYLTKGRNKISIRITNEDNVESYPYTYSTYYGNEKDTLKPKLHIIGIGLSEFEEKKYNLKYPAKDVRDFVKLFQNQKNQYSKIIIDTLINERATLDSILKLKEKILQDHPNDSNSVGDKIIIFLATHGMLDQNLDYYLATYDINFNNPSDKGLLYSELEKILDKIPPRNKVVLIDACHSGEIDKDDLLAMNAEPIEENKEILFRSASSSTIKLKEGLLNNSIDLMKEMFMDVRRTSGATVISSAGGTEYAIEGDEWNNGVFTYSLINALRKHSADKNKNNMVQLSELQKYIETEVPAITGGRQQPTSRSENISNDIVLWINDFNEELAGAIKINDKELVDKLIKEGADVSSTDANGATTLMWAVLYGDLNLLKKLIDYKADYYKKGIIFNNPEKTSYYGSLLATAAGTNKMDILKFLIEEKGININDIEINSNDNTLTGWTPLYYAVVNENEEMLDYLISKGAEVNLCPGKNKISAGLYAFMGKSESICEKLISSGMNIRQTDSSGATIIIEAIYSSNIEVLKFAIKNYKEGLNIPNKTMNYPINYACFTGNIEYFRLLVKNGAKTEIITSSGESLLHMAARAGNIEMVKECYNIMPQAINTLTKNGNSPLLSAAIEQKIDVVEYLCSKGANIKIKNSEGDDLLSLAKYYNNSQMLDIVKKYSK